MEYDGGDRGTRSSSRMSLNLDFETITPILYTNIVSKIEISCVLLRDYEHVLTSNGLVTIFVVS
jgi:hypothetical protein